MQVENLREVLVWTVAFHENLKECLRDCAKENEDERARMTLEYLVGHEESLGRIVNGFVKTAESKALNTMCYDYLEKHPIVKHGHCDSPFKSLDTDHVMEKLVDQHEQVIALYEHLYSRVDINAAKELLDAIKDVEENEIKRMVHSANRLSDM
ncbi:ATPase [Aliidiomarina indica]|uniref:ATPase n=1 Tax=Aliidiomarina indica TaxID=2749147 RepID=UPI00188F1F7A|nr:ATPase [Aliidiomarina indica]